MFGVSNLVTAHSIQLSLHRGGVGSDDDKYQAHPETKPVWLGFWGRGAAAAVVMEIRSRVLKAAWL